MDDSVNDCKCVCVYASDWECLFIRVPLTNGIPCGGARPGPSEPASV